MSCLSQQRQLFLGMSLYLEDNNQTFPAARDDTVGVNYILWLDKLRPYLLNSQPDLTVLGQNQPLHEVMACPSLYGTDYAVSTQYNGIGYNDYGLGHSIGGWPWVSIETIHKPTDIYVTADSWWAGEPWMSAGWLGWAETNYFPGYDATNPSLNNKGVDYGRHLSSANFAYADGHAETIGRDVYEGKRGGAWLFFQDGGPLVVDKYPLREKHW